MTEQTNDEMYQSIVRAHAEKTPGVRVAIHTDETFRDEDGNYLVLAFSDGGYVSLRGFWSYDTFPEARADAERLNASIFDLSPDDAFDIVVISMFAPGGSDL